MDVIALSTAQIAEINKCCINTCRVHLSERKWVTPKISANFIIVWMLMMSTTRNAHYQQILQSFVDHTQMGWRVWQRVADDRRKEAIYWPFDTWLRFILTTMNMILLRALCERWNVGAHRPEDIRNEVTGALFTFIGSWSHCTSFSWLTDSFSFVIVDVIIVKSIIPHWDQSVFVFCTVDYCIVAPNRKSQRRIHNKIRTFVLRAMAL